MPTLSGRSLALLALALLCAGCRSSSEGPSPEQLVGMHYETALRYYDMNELERAQDQVQRGLEIDRRDERLRLLLGWILQRRGDTQSILRAENVFRELDAGDYRAVLGLAQARERKGVLFDETARDLDAVSETDKADAERAANLRRDAKRAWRAAAEGYERTLELQPSDQDAMNGLQRVHALLGQDEESVEWSERLIESVGQHVAFWRAQLEDPDITTRREATLRRLLEGSVELEAKTHLHAASVLRRLGRREEAIAHLDRVVELSPDLPEAHSRRAQIYYELGAFEDALASLDRYLRLAPEPFDSPGIRRAYELRAACETEIAEAGTPE